MRLLLRPSGLGRQRNVGSRGSKRKGELRKSAGEQSSEKRSGYSHFVLNKIGVRGRAKARSSPLYQAVRGLQAPRLTRDKPRGICRMSSVVRINEDVIRLACKQFGVIMLPFKPKRRSRNHSQRDVSLPSMVSSRLSLRRNTSIRNRLRPIF